MKLKMNLKYIVSLVCWVMATITIQSQELDTYLKIAIQNSPQVKAAYSTFEAALQRTPQANALPDPMLTASAFGKMMGNQIRGTRGTFLLLCKPFLGLEHWGLKKR